MKRLTQTLNRVKNNPVFEAEFRKHFPDKYRPGEPNNSRCPWHDDKVFSLQIHHVKSHPKYKTHAYCHGCRKWFDRIDLDMLVSGRRFCHSVTYLAAKDGLAVDLMAAAWALPLNRIGEAEI